MLDILRQMHGTILGVLIVIALSLIAFIAVKILAHGRQGEETETVRKWSTKIFLAILSIAAIALVGRYLLILSTNRIPRNAEDRQGIYDQSEEQVRPSKKQTDR